MRACLLLLALVLSYVCASGSLMNLVLFDTPTSAVCNDGTPAGFYFRNGSGSGLNRFVIHLQGGAWCNDEDSCAYRWQSSENLMSSSVWTETIDMTEGLFNSTATDNSWYNANQVYTMYCSSDVWSGNGSITYSNGVHWEFRGKVIIQSVIDLLWSSYGLDKSTQILFSGCSAGGQGVIVNLDFVAELLKSKGSSALIKGFADAGWLQNFVPYYDNLTSTSYQMTTGYTLWNGVVEKNCKFANPGWEWLCYFSPFAYPHISTPIFIQTEQFDTYQVTSNIGNPPFVGDQWTYVQSIRDAFVASLQIVTGKNSFFSAACFHHCSSEDNSYNSITINGNTLANVLSNWYFGVSIGPVRELDLCRGFNCSIGCPANEY